MLQANKLSKSYQGRKVVDAVSFDISPGEIVGLLGPNGAGKSTTIGMLCGLIAADAGSVMVDGVPVSTTSLEIKQRLGLVPQDIALFEPLSAQTNLEIFGALYGLGGHALTARINNALNMVGLEDRARDRVETFSGGMKRRLNIAAALLHDPGVILLDEPTVGVDPQSRNAIFDNLQTLKSQGKAIVYSTHYMEEAERLCDRIVILDKGRMVANDTIDNLHRLLPATNVLDIDIQGTFILESIEAIAGVTDVALKSADAGIAHLSLTVQNLATDTAQVLAAVSQSGATVTHLISRRDNLETLFLNLTGRALRDGTDGT